jgi:hypothetical protein
LLAAFPQNRQHFVLLNSTYSNKCALILYFLKALTGIIPANGHQLVGIF